ncbi:MAG TPA: squalene/phytoene synthase family protein [Trebonia sp.]|jgi:phytoene synthase|nr:squalene/phytoene synthase family protein [Trebonia sp.]
MDAEEAYAECERITWEQARNFAYGIRLLPPPKRRALAAVYAYARRLDDIGDGDLPAADRAAALEEARGQVHALVVATGGTLPASAVAGPLDDADPVLVALTDAGRRLPVPLAAFGELIDGCLADVHQAQYQTFAELHHYCRCVAGSIGRLSLGVYRGVSGGSPPLSRGGVPPGVQVQMADDLGIALQITNILRDVVEDFHNGRVYLPAEDLAKFGCELVPGQAEPFEDPAWQAGFASLVEFEASRAREWYSAGWRLLATIDWRSAACTGAMAGIYRRLLEKIAASPQAVLQGRMSLPGTEKALVAVRALSGVDRGRAGSAVRVLPESTLLSRQQQEGAR